jgi:pimeloyl-ACP methyl ester carboxylesterase
MTAPPRVTDFASAGIRCAAWHLTASSAALANAHGRPCVVMGHGFGGTRDCALLPYAEGLADAGLDVLVFDYRGFGDSDGTPRQCVSFRRQRADYHAAIAAARLLDGVDPHRIVLWGTSYSGGHVVPVAVEDGRIAAVVSLTPAMDGLTVLTTLAGHAPRALAGLTAHGVRDAAGVLLGRAPHHVLIVGAPGTPAMITTPGALEGYAALAGPTWRNEVCARAALEVALNRPGRRAADLRCPILVQVGERDSVAPPAAARRAAARAGGYAELKTYPVDHFDVYAGTWQRRALADQVEFLTRRVGVACGTPAEQIAGQVS